MISKEEVLNALRHVNDPDFKKDLVTLNMIDDIEVEGNRVSFTVVLTTPACPLKDQIASDCVQAIHHHVDADAEVNINFTAKVTTLRDNQQQILPDVKNIIAVASGKGGVGKSTVSVNLALGLAGKGARVGLLDADIYGPSVPIMLDLDDYVPRVVDQDGKKLMIPAEKYGIKALSIGFLVKEDQAVVWRGPMASGALKQFVTDSSWGELDYLIIDLPPGTGDIHLTLVQTVPVTGAVIVTTPQEVAMADARKAIAMFNQPAIQVPVLGIVENMAWFTPEELPDHKYYLFGKEGGKNIAAHFDIPLLGQIPIVQGIREGGDEGQPAVLQSGISADAFSGLAERLAQQVAIRNASLEATRKVEMTS